MTGGKNRILTMLLAVLILLPVLSVAVFAETSDKEPCHIEVDMNVPDSDRVYDTHIYLYKVASAQVDENGNRYMESVKLYKDIDFNSITQDEMPDVLDELCKRLKYPGVSSGSDNNLMPMAVKKTGKNGFILFDNLDQGAYLLMKWESDAPELLEMVPALVCLPTCNQENGNLEYAVRVTPKFSWKPDEPVSPPSEPDTQLPQTGMVQWPVPVLIIAGLFVLAIGIGMNRRGKQDKNI